jgi:hypothetical protein
MIPQTVAQCGDCTMFPTPVTLWLALSGLAGRTTSPRRRPAFRRPHLEVLEDRSLPSTVTVLNNLDGGAGSLRAAITAARSGDTIAFASSLDGQTITLTSGELAISKSLDIEGPGAGLLAVSGNHTGRVFAISQNQQTVFVTIAGLMIEDGLASGAGGGGILNVSSTLNLRNDGLSSNVAFDNSDESQSQGGAILNRNGAMLTITNCNLSGNQAIGRDGGGRAFGGAIYNKGATVTVTGGSFTDNVARGGDGGKISIGEPFIGHAFGGAIMNDTSGALSVTTCTFTDNEAIAGNGGNGDKGDSYYSIDVGLGGGIIRSFRKYA